MIFLFNHHIGRTLLNNASFISIKIFPKKKVAFHLWCAVVFGAAGGAPPLPLWFFSLLLSLSLLSFSLIYPYTGSGGKFSSFSSLAKRWVLFEGDVSADGARRGSGKGEEIGFFGW
ncbi:hypothetical protein F2Q69_00013689 [Brassica cretica]|uniref:Uncharacterized protein n=1 Tax=Brassica cretica TaxID=69181 RepID=A0A8S9R618_BRACR|nr:hypothetical protein F2Q69_00013689 [Brassica cretica]